MDHHDHDNKALTAFNQLWESKFAKDSLLVFSTGRSHALYTDLRVRQMHFTPLSCIGTCHLQICTQSVCALLRRDELPDTLARLQY